MKLTFIALKLLALLLMAFTAAVHRTMFSSAPARSQPSDVWITLAVVAVLFGVSHLWFPSWLDKTVTLAVLVVGLILPGVGVGMRVVTAGENSERRQRLVADLEQILAPGHAAELAHFLIAPESSRVALYEEQDVERIAQRLLQASPEELRAHHLAHCLLMGMTPTPSTYGAELQPTTGLDALSRLYVAVKARAGFSVEGAPFYLQQQDRVVSRIAEVGHVEWKREVNAENPLFGRLIMRDLFSTDLANEVLPQPLPPGTRVVSRTQGSLPLQILMLEGKLLFPLPPGVPSSPLGDQAYAEELKLQELRDHLGLLRAKGMDFTEEEKALPGLAELLERVRTVKER